MAEEALEKKGQELFKELLRYYPVAYVEDYNKNGGWRDDLMRLDLQLVHAHRIDGGAPEVIPLDQVVLPEDMPKAYAAGMLGIGASRTAVPILRPTGAAGAGVTITPAGGALAQLKEIALFVAKFKMDPTKTKMHMAKVNAVRRKHIIENFSTEETEVAAFEALEAFIKEQDELGLWPEEEGKTATNGTEESTPTTAGVKRPLTGGVVVSAATKPRIIPSAAVAAARAGMGAKVTPLSITKPAVKLGVSASIKLLKPGLL